MKTIFSPQHCMYFAVVSLMIIVYSCHKVTIGYLITEHAGYQIDSLVVKTELDTTAPQQVPNPIYQMYVSMGASPATLAQVGIFPTITISGGVDYDRYFRGEPWTSTAIEGIEGTMPVIVSISGIKTTDGNADKLKEFISVRGNGMFTVPLFHDIPPGRYIISLNFKNEGYSQNRENVFTVIVK